MAVARLSEVEVAWLPLTGEARTARVRELVAAYHASVWKFVRRLGAPAAVADDVVQEVFVVAFRRLESIREGSERSFLFSTAYRTTRGVLKRGQLETAVEQLDGASDATPDPEEILDRKRACELAYRLLAELDPDLRAPFVMFEIEEMTMQEIASAMGLPVPTVGSRLRRAREDFNARIKRHRARLRGDL